MTAKLLVLGLDAAEATVLNGDLNRFATLSGMRSGGAFGRLVGLHRTLIDTVWPEIHRGISATQSGIHYPLRQMRTGEKRPRRLLPTELAVEWSYWNLVARAGRKVAAIDLPYNHPSYGNSDAQQVSGWGTHHVDEPNVSPAEGQLHGVVYRRGHHPLTAPCSLINDGTERGRRELRRALVQGVQAKGLLLADALEANAWDLFSAVYSESHCGGHHLWAEAVGQAGDVTDGCGGAAIQEIYVELDRSLGRVIEKAGDGATVIVYSSHGMGPGVIRSAGIVAEVVEGMGLVRSNHLRRRLSAAVPARVRARIKRHIDSGYIQRVGFTHDRPFGGRGTRAIPLPAEAHGAIRFAIAGRDPGASLRQGSDEHQELIAELREVFGSLQHPETGEPIVEDVVLLDEEFGHGRHPDLPDVVVRYRQGLAEIRECVSPQLGLIQPVGSSNYVATHGTPGFIWMTGPGVEAGTDLGDVQTVDLAPTVLELLGVEIPDWIDGTPIKCRPDRGTGPISD
jgi:predicted AlkP superfamily phosphohydrolase/phosphomutase